MAGEKIKLICKACNKENERVAKPEPKNKREANQVYFICSSCGAKNLRDGLTATYKKELPKEEPRKAEPAKELKHEEPIKEPEEKNRDTREESGSGFFF